MIRMILIGVFLPLLAAHAHCGALAMEDSVPDSADWFWDGGTFIINLTGTVLASTENVGLTCGWLLERSNPRFTQVVQLGAGDTSEYLRTVRKLAGGHLFPPTARHLVKFLEDERTGVVVLRAAYRIDSHLVAFKAEAHEGTIIRLAVFADGPLERSTTLLPEFSSPSWFRQTVDCRFDAGKHGRHAGHAFLYSLRDTSANTGDTDRNGAAPENRASMSTQRATPKSSPEASSGKPATALEQRSEARQRTDANTGEPWLYVALGFAGAAAVGAVGMWLLLRRRAA